MTQPHATTIVYNIGTLVTPAAPDADGVVRGDAMNEVVVLTGAPAAVAIDDRGVIIGVGRETDVRAAVVADDHTNFIDAAGGLVTPGLVDCHAHPVFGGDRADEFELRNQGADYETLHREGGGIRRTVELTREAIGVGTIDDAVAAHYDWMIAAGTTTAEAKSGYGLSVADELDMLRAARRVAATHPLTVVTTALPAHTVPVEYATNVDRYLDEVAIPVLQQAAAEGLATAADIFLERGSFNAEHAARYLDAARDAGLIERLHADQFTDGGGIELAVARHARSVDHLEALEADADRLQVLARSSTTAVLLPLSSLFLSRPFAPGRALVDAGAIVAVASDFNPGSSYGESLTIAMSLACTGCGLSAAEALTAVTANAAHVLGVGSACGRLEVGFRGDVVVFDQPDLRHLAYHFGSPGIRSVISGGVAACGTGS